MDLTGISVIIKIFCFSYTTFFVVNFFVVRGCLSTLLSFIVQQKSKVWKNGWYAFHSIQYTLRQKETVKTLICQLNTMEGTHVLMVQRILSSVLLVSNIFGGIIAYHLLRLQNSRFWLSKLVKYKMSLKNLIKSSTFQELSGYLVS